MSFISFNNNQQQQQPSSISSSTSSSIQQSRRESNATNEASGEWTAISEVLDSNKDPFGDQEPSDSNNDNGYQQQRPLIDPFGNSQTRTVIKKLGLKRNSQSTGQSNIETKVKLDRVCGLTVTNNSSLDCDPFSATVVYSSGCVLVLYNQRKNKQFHIINSLKKPITACKFSKDGKYIVTGECGHQPHGRVWEVSTGEQVASLSGHKYGINCVAFSPDGKYVVSIGSQHDMMVNVWDWRSNHIVASNKVSVKVKSISFAEDGDYFVTVGNRHVKFWYLEYNDIVAKTNRYESLPLMGRNAILGDQRNNYFCDVACGRGEHDKDSTYAITKSGLLCEFNNRRLLNKWVELKTESANCITISQNYILVGCAQGVIRCFRPQTLEFICTLPRPHSLGLDIAKGFTTRNDSNLLINKPMSQTKPKHADTVAVVYDDYNKIVTAIYADRSIYFWSMNDIKRIGKLNSFLYHSSCIWDIDIYPFDSKHSRHLLPPGTFLTCSSDDTIRIWNTEVESNSTKASTFIYKKNFFSPELLKILYMDPELTYLCDPDFVSSRSAANGNGAQQSDQYDSKNGIRAIKFSADGKHLASGDRCGNIRIFDLEMQKDLFKIEAHDGEVLCLEYSNEQLCGRALLVSASRDRFIHVYDVHGQYSCIQNIDDHSSSITSVKFVWTRHFPTNLLLISCGADKSLIFRRQSNPDSDFKREHHVAGKSTFFDMAVDYKKNQIITASQDRLIRTYDVKTGKNTNSFKGSMGEDGALIKIAFDPSATFIATSCTDKSIYIYDYLTGECLAATSGHSEIVTGLKFSLDGRHLISISGDGCIFVWRLPVEMTNAIASKLGLPLISDSCQITTISNRSLNIPLQHTTHEPIKNGNGINNNDGIYRFNVSTLPSWARKQSGTNNDRLNGDNPLSTMDNDEGKEFSKTLPRGRWAQRFKEEAASAGGPADIIVNTGLVKTYASTFESLASRSTPTTPSGIHSPTMKDAIYKNQNRASLIIPSSSSSTTTIVPPPRTKSSMSSGVEDDDDDRNTTDSDNTCSHDSSYKVTKVTNDRIGSAGSSCSSNGGTSSQNRSPLKHLDQYSMVSSISMANINDLPYDDDDGGGSSVSENGAKSKDDDTTTVGDSIPNNKNSRYNSSLYMSTENLERIDQRNRYLKNIFENIDKSNIDNNNSASDDSGINQIEHSLSSTTTASGVTLINLHNQQPPQPSARQSLSSKYKIETSPSTQSNNDNNNLNGHQYDERTSDDATLSDITDITNNGGDQHGENLLPTTSHTTMTLNVNGGNDLTKFSVLDTIKESLSIKEGDTSNVGMDSTPSPSTNGGSTTTILDSTAKTLINNDSSSMTKTTMDTTSSSSLSSQQQPPKINNDNDVVGNVKSPPTQPSMSKKKEEMAKTLSEAKRKLQTVGSNRLTNSKSVTNLRSTTLFSPRTSSSIIAASNQQQPQLVKLSDGSKNKHHNLNNSTGGDELEEFYDYDDDGQSYHSLSIDAFRKSISLSDLHSRSSGAGSSYTLPRKLSIFRNNNNNLQNTNGAASSMNNYQFAPLWDQRQRGGGSGTSNGTGSLSRTPSSNALNKVDMMRSQSTLCRQGLWNVQQNGINGVNSPAAASATTATVNGTPSLSVINAHPMNPAVAHLKPPPMPPSMQNGGNITGQSPQPMVNPRSGRSSAPPSQFRKSTTTLSCASSSRRGDSTEDDEEMDGSAINSDDENSDEHRTMRPRPVTPPKPNLLKQIRRVSNSNAQQMNMNLVQQHPQQTHPVMATPVNHQYSSPVPGHHHYIQNPHQPPSVRPRRLWSTDTMRSSKSEFNLANIGRDVPMRRRNNSGIMNQTAVSTNMWPPNPAGGSTIPSNPMMTNDRFDLYMTNPSSIPLSLDLCQHLVNEMNFLTNYASRIYERASFSENVVITDYLKETLGQVSRDIQAIIAGGGGRSGLANGSIGTNTMTKSSTIPDMQNLHSMNGKAINEQQPQTGDSKTSANQQNFELFQQFLAYMEMRSAASSNTNNNVPNGLTTTPTMLTNGAVNSPIANNKNNSVSSSTSSSSTVKPSDN